MTTNIISSTTIGWAAITTGVSAILALVFLILMYTVKRSFGRVNDYFNGLIGISSVILAGLVQNDFYAISPLISIIAVIVSVVGAIFIIIGSILAIFTFTDFVLAGWYSGIGFALIGLWLVAYCYTLLSRGLMPHSMFIYGIVAGAFMAIGLLGIPGTIAKIDSMESMPWYLYGAFFSWLGTYILYPIWAIWWGQNLLVGKL